MANQGFKISEDLPGCVELNVPQFTRVENQLTVDEERKTRIASVHVHVECAIERIKSYKKLPINFPTSMIAEPNKVWVICYLVNFYHL